MEIEILKLWCIIALSSIGAIVQSNDMYRLPNDTIPKNYVINIITYLEKNTFEGTVQINVTCLKDTDTIVLNSDSLAIDSVMITDNNRNIPVSKVSLDAKTTRMYIKSAEKLKTRNKYVLCISFKGKMTNDIEGYIISRYIDKKINETRLLSYTIFEPTGARKMFPCYDELKLKAKFKISLSHEKGYTSASNTKLIKTTTLSNNEQYVIDEFEESRPMSSFTVAFMISKLYYVKSNNQEDEVNFRIIVREDAVNQTQLAKQTVPLLLKFLEDYFKQSFPLKKIDFVGIPDSIGFDAQDDFGLVFYDEQSLLVDLNIAKAVDIALVVQDLGYDLSLQWLGNCVTMEWWSDNWFYNGFASYISYRGVDKLYPSWNYIELSVDNDFTNVMDIDSLQSSHPVSIVVDNPDEAQIFDYFTSEKGSCLIYMMTKFLGEEIFKSGLTKYINKYQFSNGKLDDFWYILTEEAHKARIVDMDTTVNEIMDKWINDPGYPIVVLTRDPDGIATLSQKRFLSDSTTPEKDSCWWVPITLATSINPEFSQTKEISWLNCKNTQLIIPLDEKVKWVILNLQMTDCLKQTMTIFKEWMKATDPDRSYNIIPKQYIYTITCQAIKNGNTDMWNFLLERYLHANIDTLKTDLIRALCCSSNNLLLNRLLDWTIGNNNIIPKSNQDFVFREVAMYNTMGYYVAKSFLYQRIADIHKHFADDINIVGDFVYVVGSQMKTDEELDEIQKFIIKNSIYLKGTESILHQMILNIKKNIVWMKNNYNKFGEIRWKSFEL